MDYTEFPQDNLECGEYNFNLLYRLYGNSERRLLRPGLSSMKKLSKEALDEYRAAVDQASQDLSCADCRLDLSNGYRIFVHKLLL